MNKRLESKSKHAPALRDVLGAIVAGARAARNMVYSFALAGSVGVTSWYKRRARVVNEFPALRLCSASDRLLVVVPHPDDEVLACGGAILSALEAGASVHIVFLTLGDGFWIDAALLAHHWRPSWEDNLKLGQRRLREAQNASKSLGLPKENLFFLGYPDRGLMPMIRLEGSDAVYHSIYTGVDRVPYKEALSPEAQHTLGNLLGDLETVLERVKPTVLLAPSSRDAHPDHQASAELVARTLGSRRDIRRYEWIIHGGLEWPLPKGFHPRLALVPPPRGRGLSWERLDIDHDQVRTKSQAIGAHHSQVLLMSRYLNSFARRNELFAQVAAEESDEQPTQPDSGARKV